MAASAVRFVFYQTTSAYQRYTKQVNQSRAHNNRRRGPTSRRRSRSPTASALEPARSIVFTGNGPNGLKIEKETTHDLLSRRRFMKMA